MKKSLLALVMLASASGMAFPIGARTGMWNQGKAALPFKGLVLTAAEPGATVCFKSEEREIQKAPAVNLEVSFDLGTNWVGYTVGDVITLTNQGDRVCFCAGAGGNKAFASGYNSDFGYSHFVLGRTIYASGNVYSLLSRDYKRMTSLAGHGVCFNRLFRDCVGLLSAPELPATTLANACYTEMFRGCTSLKQPPELPAPVIDGNCYLRMFSECSSLERIPYLPATTMMDYCYKEMFSGCSSIKEPVKLPVTTLAKYSLHSMFASCTNLNSIAIAYEGDLSNVPSMSLAGWVYNVAPTGTFYYNGPGTARGESAIPEGWTVEPYVP